MLARKILALLYPIAIVSVWHYFTVTFYVSFMFITTVGAVWLMSALFSRQYMISFINGMESTRSSLAHALRGLRYSEIQFGFAWALGVVYLVALVQEFSDSYSAGYVVLGFVAISAHLPAVAVTHGRFRKFASGILN